MIKHIIEATMVKNTSIISLVFSFRNEAQNIPELIRRVSAALKITNFGYELIFVNDCSTDNSIELLKELQTSYPIKIITMSRRFGVTPCIMAGLASSCGSAVIIMDSDLQDPPELIPELIKRFEEGADVVHTTRKSRKGENRFKMWLTKQAYKIINIVSDISLPENTGDYKLLSRRVVEHILHLKEYDPYMRGLSVWVGYHQDYVLYDRDARWAGNTKFPLLSKGPLLEFIRGLTAYSAGPLYLSLIFGGLAALLSIFVALYAVLIKILGISASGVSSILIIISFFSGVILVSNGILGIYVAKIYYEVKGRPRYIIKETISPIDDNEE
jgi:glycosyltransferase involved in cell wall biosynthesis